MPQTAEDDVWGGDVSQVSVTIYVSLTKRQQAAGPRLCLETRRCSRQPELTLSRWLIAGSVLLQTRIVSERLCHYRPFLTLWRESLEMAV